MAQEDVEQAVLMCVKYIIDSVVYQARARQRVEGLWPRVIHHVPGKRGHRKTEVRAWYSQRDASGLVLTRRMRARLTQRKRESKGYNYRDQKLKRAAAARAERDLEWLQVHGLRLATIVARQDLGLLLPEGMTAAR